MQLWLAHVEAPLPPGSNRWLDSAEREKLQRMRDPAEQRRRTVAWTLRRWALTRAHPAVDETEWRFSEGRHGKPELVPGFRRLGLHHNLSHGGDFAAVVTAPCPCGIDVEARPAGLEAAEVVFGPEERADIAAHLCPPERFLQHWVAKEAILKLIGLGLAASPETLELTLARDGRSAVAHPVGNNPPALPPGTMARLWPLPGHHWLAVACAASDGVLEPEWVPWSAG